MTESLRVATAGAPVSRAKAAMVVLHGRGATAAGILSLADVLAQPAIAYVAPQAPGNAIRTEGGDLVIGAPTSMSDCAAHPDTQRLQPLVSEPLVEGATPQAAQHGDHRASAMAGS